MSYTSTSHPSFHKHDDQICEDPACHQRLMDQRLGEAIAATYARDSCFKGECDSTKRLEKLFDQVESIRASGHVARWHTMPQLGDRQSVAEHSWHAVSILLLLHPSPSLSLIKALSWHDTAERVVGDVPAPVRRANPEFAEMYERMEAIVHDEHHPAVARAMTDLTEEERHWLKAIDVLELVMHCYDLEMLGNKHASIVCDRARMYLKKEPNTPKIVQEFLQHYFGRGPRSFV